MSNDKRLACEIFQGDEDLVQAMVNRFMLRYEIDEHDVHRVDYSAVYDTQTRSVIHCVCIWYRVTKEWK